MGRNAAFQVEVLRMWERDSRTLALRWKLRCFPHLLTGKLVNLDGISEYRFNDSGLIYQHTVRTSVRASWVFAGRTKAELMAVVSSSPRASYDL